MTGSRGKGSGRTLWTADVHGVRLRQLWYGTNAVCLGLAARSLVRMTADWGAGAHDDPAMWIVVALLLAGVVLTRRVATLGLGLVLLGSAALVTGCYAPGAAASGCLLTVTTVCLATTLRMRPAVELLGALAVAYVVCRVLAGLPLTSSVVDNVVMSVIGCCAVAGLLGSWVDETRRVDQLHRDTLTAELGDALGEAAQQVDRDVERLIHEDVIPALVAISDASSPDGHAARAAATRAIAGIETATGSREKHGSRLADLIAAVAWESSLETVVRPPTDLTAARVTVDEQVWAAVGRAIAEALRNAAKHADATRAQIDWAIEHDHLVVRVHDDGRGLATGPAAGAGAAPAADGAGTAPASGVGRGLAGAEATDTGSASEPAAIHPRSGGWGIQCSIQEPMQSIGGSAQISGEHGVTVTLRWPMPTTPAPALVTSFRETMDALPSTRQMLPRLVVPVVALHPYMAVRYSWNAIDHVTAQLTLAVAMTFAVLGLLILTTTRPLTRTQLIAIALGGAVIDAVGLWMAGPAALHAYSSLVIGFVAVLVAVPSFFTPARWSLVMITPSVLVATTTALIEGYGVLGALDPLAAAAVTPAVAALLGARLRADRRSALADLERLRVLAQRAERDRLRSITTNPAVTAIREDAAPLLAAIADGTLDTADPTVRSRAHVLALGLRDELQLPGRLDAHLRARLRAARLAGASIRLVAGEDRAAGGGGPDRALGATALRVLDRLLDLNPQPTTMLVQFPATQAHGLRVQLRPPLRPSQIQDLRARLAANAADLQPGTFATTLRVDLQHLPESAIVADEVTLAT